MTVSQASWVGTPHIRGYSEPMRMFLLTASMIGLQFAWGTEMTYCTPYLLSLGMSKSRLSLVWIAGPLSGLVMQPLIGMLSDKSTSRYGRRRPYMVGGTIAVVLCYIILGWTKEIAGIFTDDAELQRKRAITIAIVDIFVLDFVINIAQSTCRALVVDTLPISKQQLGAAWISRMTGLGHLLVFAVGSQDLSILGNKLGDTQFKKVCVIAAVAMALAQGLSCWAVQERILVAERETQTKGQNLLSILRQIYGTLLYLPDRIQAICWVQFWGWIGWFPFLFYGSTWVGEIYLRYENPALLGSSRDALEAVGQQGSRALIVYSIVGTLAAIVLPPLIQNPGEDEKAYTVRPPHYFGKYGKYLSGLGWRKPSLLRMWALGNLLFAAAMIWAPVVHSVAFATLLVGLCGIPSAVGGVAAITFLGVEVNRMSASLPQHQGQNQNGIPRRTSSLRHQTSQHARRKSNESALEFDHSLPLPQLPSHQQQQQKRHRSSSRSSSPKILHLRHDSTGSFSSFSAAGAANGYGGAASTGELSGIYLGILNIYTTLPQFVGTGVSWVVFSLMEPGGGVELAAGGSGNGEGGSDRGGGGGDGGVSAIGVCLFIGALSAVGAAWATRRLRGVY